MSNRTRRDRPDAATLDVWARLDAWEAFFRANPDIPVHKRWTRAELDKLAVASDFKAVLEVAGKALDGSGEYKPGTSCTVEWDVSGKCAMPRVVSYHKKGVRLMVELTVPCRTDCEHCLRKRRLLWTGRAKEELRQAHRSWFGTITLSPDFHYRVVCQADALATKAGVDFTGLLPGDQLRYRHKVIGAELTKWLKRVRKVSGAPLRYCLVMEAHKSGLPHYHVLVHELAPNRPVLYRHLCDSWHMGFVKFNLVDQTEDGRAAWYVCKYLSKSALARVRASGRYGERRSSSIGPELDRNQLDHQGGRAPGGQRGLLPPHA